MVRRPFITTSERGRKLRYDIILKEKVNKIRKPEVVLNLQPLRPGNLREEFESIVASQWHHHSYDGKKWYRWIEVTDDQDVAHGYIFFRDGGTYKHSFSVSIRQV